MFEKSSSMYLNKRRIKMAQIKTWYAFRLADDSLSNSTTDESSLKSMCSYTEREIISLVETSEYDKLVEENKVLLRKLREQNED